MILGAAVLVTNVPASALYDPYDQFGGGWDVSVIYESAPTGAGGRVLPERLPGMTKDEIDRSAIGTSAVTGAASPAHDLKTKLNTLPPNTKAAPTTLTVRHGVSSIEVPVKDPKGLELYAQMELLTWDVDGETPMDPGWHYQTGVSFTFSPDVVNSADALIARVFSMSGNDFAYCVISGSRSFDCIYSKSPRWPTPPKDRMAPPVRDTDEWRLFAENEAHQVPVCAGLVTDGGAGMATEVAVSDASCAATASSEPVRLEIAHASVPEAWGSPYVDGDGRIRYEATAEAEGRYAPILAYAVAEDGTHSWPFPVVVRNRFAPRALQAGTVETSAAQIPCWQGPPCSVIGMSMNS